MKRIYGQTAPSPRPTRAAALLLWMAASIFVTLVIWSLVAMI